MTRIGRFSILSVLGAVIVMAAPPSRIQGPVQRNRTAVLKGHTHRSATKDNDRGELDGAFRVENLILMLKPSDEQAVELEKFLEEQRDPASPDFQRWLTPEEFGERFGANPTDTGVLTSWLESEGFEVGEVARGRNWVSVKGTAGQIARTFRTALHRYEVDGEAHFANATDPSVPLALAAVVMGIRGLDDFRPHPQRSQARSAFTASNGAHYLAPDDLAAIYNLTALYKGGYDGTGLKIVVPGQTEIRLSDVRAFRARFGLAAKDPQVVLFGASPGTRVDDQIEAHLDVEWAGAVARNSTIVYVTSRDVFTSLQYAIDQNLAPVISLSYGGCEIGNPAGFRSVAQQANAQGITWLNASGDSGAAGCDYNVKVAGGGPAVTFPANIPEVTAVGGTEFNESSGAGWNVQNGTTFSSASGYIAEKAWNDTALGHGLSSTGGGASQVYAKPWWQTGPGVPDDKARDVPDVSLTASGAHDGYLIYSGGQLLTIGGTSASSPAFAGIVALLNQYLVAKGTLAKAGLGNINPALYNLAQKTLDIFHDTVLGDNIVPCAAGSKGCAAGSFGYRAGPGYDLVTGLGSVDAYNLVTQWSSQPAGVGTTGVLTASPAALLPTESTQLTAVVSPVSGAAFPAGTVTFSAGNNILGSAPLSVAAGRAVATLTVKGSSLSAGVNSVVAVFLASAGFSNSTASAAVTISVPVIATTTAVTSGAGSIAAGGQVQITAVVKPASGPAAPAGPVVFSSGSVTLGTVPLITSGSNGVAVLTILGTKLASGINSINASFAGAAGFGSSSGAVVVTVAAAPIGTTTAVAAAVAAIQSNGSTVLTATVRVVSGAVKPVGKVTFLLGQTALGSVGLGTGGNAVLTLKGSGLQAGANVITVNYEGSALFAASSGKVTVTLTAAAVATTTTVTATPPSFRQNATTQLTVNCKGGASGVVTLLQGAKHLGAVNVDGTGAATFTLKGSELALGAGTITARFAPVGNFTGSSGTVRVTVTAAPAAR